MSENFRHDHETETEEQIRPSYSSQNRNYSKEQEKGNFDNEAKNVYALLSAIKDDISSMKKEMNIINERITNLENKKQQNQEFDKGLENDKNKGKEVNRNINPVNDRGIISSYNRNKRSVPRNFEQHPNNTGKRGPLNSETYASTSDNINPVKARRISTNVRDGNYNHSFINKPNEVEEIRNILNDKNNQLDKLNDKIERLTVLLWNKDSNNNEKRGSSNTNNLV